MLIPPFFLLLRLPSFTGMLACTYSSFSSRDMGGRRQLRSMPHRHEQWLSMLHMGYRLEEGPFFLPSL